LTVLALTQLVEECQARAAEPDAVHAVADYLARLCRDQPLELVRLVGDDTEITVLHRAADLTVVKVVMPPLYAFYPHDHLMWGVVAGVAGREDNTFFVRDGDHITPTAGASYEAGQVGVLDEAVIHAVHNPSRGNTIGLHVYGGDLLAAPASEWDPVTGEESAYDDERATARRRAWLAQMSN
jgi:predicted metal-dependent enzyme (double-stranded beta helix superfamily)